MDAQLPFDCPQRHALAPGFLDRLPSLPLIAHQDAILAKTNHIGLCSMRPDSGWRWATGVILHITRYTGFKTGFVL